MKPLFNFDNPFRNAVESYSGIVLLISAFLIWAYPHYFLLSGRYLTVFIVLLLLLGLWRLYQAYRIYRFKKGLLHLKTMEMSTAEIPLQEGVQYVGQGFEWKAIHTQRKHQLMAVVNESLKEANQNKVSDIGGKPWIHGLGSSDQSIGILESLRNGHTLILGTTRVGKTRLLSVLVNQDIRLGKAVIFLDPKGDLEILRDMYAACKASNRLKDFKVLHVGFPELSARLNTLSSYVDISDVATRVTSAMDGTGEGAQFKDFAWKYINITARCLKELNILIHYRNLSFYLTRPDVLLLHYADTVLPKRDPHYLNEVSKLIKAAERNIFEQEGNKKSMVDTSRAAGIKKYLKNFIEKSVQADETHKLVNDILIPLYEAAAMDSTYYQKITASVGPVLDMINQSNANDIFSFETDPAHVEIRFLEAIKHKQVIYIGLNSLANREVSQALGKAVISDLVSCAARIYNSNAKSTVALYCDEFSEIVQEEFITLLNKSGGAGFQVTAACQTIQDLGVAFGGNQSYAKMLEGNFQSLIMMRVKNKETAELLVNQLPEVEWMSAAEGFSSHDVSSQEGRLFNTGDNLSFTPKSIPMLHVSDLMSLPKGHAFLLTHGGQLSKVQIPLPKNDSLAPSDFQELMRQVNRIQVKPVTQSQSIPPKPLTEADIKSFFDWIKRAVIQHPINQAYWFVKTTQMVMHQERGLYILEIGLTAFAEEKKISVADLISELRQQNLLKSSEFEWKERSDSKQVLKAYYLKLDFDLRCLSQQHGKIKEIKGEGVL